MFRFLFTLCSGALSGTSGSSGSSGTLPEATTTVADNLVPALEVLWKGMLGIFVVAGLIFLTVKVLNKLTSKKK